MGADLGPKLRPKSVPRRLPRRPLKRDPKKIPTRAQHRPPDPPQDGPQFGPRRWIFRCAPSTSRIYHPKWFPDLFRRPRGPFGEAPGTLREASGTPSGGPRDAACPLFFGIDILNGTRAFSGGPGDLPAVPGTPRHLPGRLPLPPGAPGTPPGTPRGSRGTPPRDLHKACHETCSSLASRIAEQNDHSPNQPEPQ